MSRPSRPVPVRQGRGSRPSLLRRLRKMDRAQLAFAALGLVIVCSLVAASFGVLASNLLLEDDPDPEEIAGQTDDLIEEQRERIEENPNDAQAMAILAELLSYDGDLSESIAWYQRALEIDPNNTGIRISFGQVLAEADLRNDAELQFLKVLELDANSYEAHYYLAELYRFWDPPRSDEAAFHYRRVIEIAPTAFLATRSGEMLVMMGYAMPAPAGSPAATPRTDATPAAP